MLIKRKNKVKVNVYQDFEGFTAIATDGQLSVYNCYGSTREAAREMALLQLHLFQEEVASGIQPKGLNLHETELPKGFTYSKKKRLIRFF